MKFRTRLLQAEGMNATGIEVPAKVIESRGRGTRPKVIVSINRYSYRTTAAVYAGRYYLPVAKEHRDKAGIKAGDAIEVNLQLDTAPREVDVPKDFAAALKKAKMTDRFHKLSFSHR